MNRQDVVDYIEGAFECDMGAPWRWADLMMSKPYQAVQHEGDEHHAAAALISAMDKLKRDAGFWAQDSRPKLYWRWTDKVRYEYGVMIARLYVDGNPGRDTRGNPSRPSGSPTVGQVRLLAAA